jgi:hypothetical protein
MHISEADASILSASNFYYHRSGRVSVIQLLTAYTTYFPQDLEAWFKDGLDEQSCDGGGSDSDGDEQKTGNGKPEERIPFCRKKIRSDPTRTVYTPFHTPAHRVNRTQLSAKELTAPLK